MVELNRHPVLQQIHNLATGIEDIGPDRRLTSLGGQTMNILRTVDSIVQENITMKAELAELRAREGATA